MGGLFRSRTVPPSVHPAKVDCETIRPDRFFSQPVNSASSLGFCVAGGAVIVAGGRAREDDPARTAAARALGATLVAVGVGSVLFHGPGNGPSKWLHDTSILAFANTMTAWNLYDSGLVSGPASVALATGSTTAQGVVLAYRPLESGTQGAASLGVMWAAEALMKLARRAGAPNVPQRPARLEYASTGLMLASLAGQVFGRTGFPLCRPDSLIQPHAVWHLGAAGSMGMQAIAATGPRSGPSQRRLDRMEQERPT